MRREPLFPQKATRHEPEIAIAVLDINKNEADFKYYSSQPVAHKIMTMKVNVKIICDKFKEKEKNSKWIAVAREYSITAADTRFITEADKKLLIEQMQQVTKLNTQLIFICGIAVKRDNVILTKEAKEKIIETYNLLLAENADSEIEAYKKLLEENNNALTEITNECIIIEGDKVRVINKLNAFYETSTLKSFNNQSELKKTSLVESFFNPYNTESNSSIVESSHEGKNFQFILETCLDHHSRRAWQELKLRQKFNFFEPSISDPIPLQITIGDGAAPGIANICTTYVVIDSRLKSQLIARADQANLPIRLYQISLTDDKQIMTLKGPLQPLYSKHFAWHDKMQDFKEEIESMLAKKLKSEAADVVVWEIKKKFIEDVLDKYQNDVIRHNYPSKNFIKDIKKTDAYKQFQKLVLNAFDQKFVDDFNKLIETMPTEENFCPTKNVAEMNQLQNPTKR